MEHKDKNEEMIEKLIEKRKQENDAFVKLLNAISNKTNGSEDKEKHPVKPMAPKDTKRRKDE